MSKNNRRCRIVTPAPPPMRRFVREHFDGPFTFTLGGATLKGTGWSMTRELPARPGAKPMIDVDPGPVAYSWPVT